MTSGYLRTLGREEGFEIGKDGEEGKEGGESVLAFGGPSDGLDPEGMEGPEEGQENGGERRRTETAEKEVETDGVDGVE